MQFMDLSRFVELPKRAVNALRSWRGRTEKGSDVDYRSQLDHYVPRESIVKSSSSVLTVTDETLIQFEESEKNKIGPYSIQAPWKDRVKTLQPYFTNDKELNVNEEAYQEALSYVRSFLPGGSLQPLSLDAAVDTLPKGKYSGLPFLTTKPEVLKHYITRANLVMDGGDGVVNPAVLGWRGQPGGPSPNDVKQRVIWMMDKLDAILGAQYLYPVINALRDRVQFSAWNDKDTVDNAMRLALSIASEKRVRIHSTDYDSFDSSLAARFIDDLFEVIRSWFSTSVGLDVVKTGFITCGMLTPSGVAVGREGSVPSGSIFTNLIGTLWNLLCARYVAIRKRISHPFSTALGDDAVNIYMPDVSDEEIASIQRELGMTMNADKQFTSETHAHYLQNVHGVNGGWRGVRPFYRMLNGALSYERRRDPQDWSHSMASVRTIMQLENCKWHQDFVSIVRFIANLDRYLHQYDPMDILRMAGGASKASSVLGYDSFRYTTYSLSKADSFATVKVLREIR